MLTIINHHQKAQTSFCITTEHLVPCYALVVAYGNACTVNETYTRVTTIKVLRTIGITNFYKDFLIPNSGYNQSDLFILLQFVQFA